MTLDSGSSAANASPERSTPAISVVIAAFEANATLGLQLEALAHQHDAPTFEVVVVDNGSYVPPTDVVDGWARRGLDVQLIRADAHQGTSYARNVGVREASAEWIAFCDADDCVGPLFVRSAADALTSCEVVTGNVVPVAAEVFVDGREHLWALLRPHDDGSGLRADAVDHAYPILMGGASAIRKSTFIELGGFDQAFFPGAEDNDLALRIIASGRTIARHSGMTLAERRRATGSATFGRARDAGRMHIALCAEHELWSSSPHLRNPSWAVDLAKLPLVVAKAFATGADAATKRAVAGRAGLRVGQATGMVERRLLRRPVVRQLGVGLGESTQ